MKKLACLLLVCFLNMSFAYAQEEVTIGGETFQWNGYRVMEPDTDFDPYTGSVSDINDCFPANYPITKDQYTLLEGTLMEVTVQHIVAENPGKTVYIVAGVHGDERAAWFTGVLLQGISIKSGELYIIAPANANGAKEQTRYVVAEQDLNRSFPGDENGNEAEQAANAIYQDIARVQPDFLFDLHEAIVYREGRDFLGSTLIYTKLDAMGDMFFDLLFATQIGDICSGPFGYNGPGPEGSINATVTSNLGIPTITVETFRGYPMEHRVSDQLQIVEFVLAYMGLV